MVRCEAWSFEIPSRDFWSAKDERGRRCRTRWALWREGSLPLLRASRAVSIPGISARKVRHMTKA